MLSVARQLTFVKKLMPSASVARELSGLSSTQSVQF
jgi:hypothetical protein